MWSGIFKKYDIDIHDPKYGAWVDSSIHRSFSYEYNQDWYYFFKYEPNITVEKILAFARDLAMKYEYPIYF